ncbi:MAG: DUF6775 family putative metallopeptidase [Thermodesulfobacteriota bacterium]
MINIFLYTDSPSKSLDINKLASFLYGFNFNVEDRGDFLQYLELDEIAVNELNRFLDNIRITDIEKPIDDLNRKTVTSELNENITNKNFLDGFWLQRKMYSYLYEKNSSELNQNNLHLIISRKLFGTFGTKRYHARVLLTGDPALISTSGIVEAPARPREYYFVKAKFLSMGKKINELDEIYKDRFVNYDDPKITNILCSYALQQIKSKIAGEPFCENSECCLYNSHWQEEVLILQYKNVMCDECLRILNSS